MDSFGRLPNELIEKIKFIYKTPTFEFLHEINPCNKYIHYFYLVININSTMIKFKLNYLEPFMLDFLGKCIHTNNILLYEADVNFDVKNDRLIVNNHNTSITIPYSIEVIETLTNAMKKYLDCLKSLSKPNNMEIV